MHELTCDKIADTSTEEQVAKTSTSCRIKDPIHHLLFERFKIAR
jgi:hypothetical protein